MLFLLQFKFELGFVHKLDCTGGLAFSPSIKKLLLHRLNLLFLFVIFLFELNKHLLAVHVFFYTA